jgi:oxygen-dependent protoporphyrinogen oxidase
MPDLRSLQPSASSPLDVAIIGAGIAGLAAAYELSTRQASFVVLERAPRAGGVIFSESVDGFTIDGGPDSLLIQKPEAIALCKEIGLGDQLVSTTPPRIAYIQRGGRLHALPEASVLGIPTRVGPFVRSTLFSWPGKLRMGAELFVPRKRDESDESIGAFISRRFGREAVTYLAEPLLAGIHAGDVDRLSVHALFPRLVAAERQHGSLLRAFSIRNPARPPQSRIGGGEGAFKSLPGGLSDMVHALVKAIGSAHIRTSTSVDRVTGSGPFFVHTSTGESIESRAVILATPAYATSELMRERDEELANLAGGISYASAATVALAFARTQVQHSLTGSGFVVPRVERTGILAASWLSSKWPNRAPQDRVLMRTFVGGARDPRALDRSDAGLVQVSLAALQPLLGIEGAPMFTRVYHWNRGNAQHDVGHLERVAAIDRALTTRHPGLFLTGSGFRGVGIPDCVADGRRVGATAADWLRNLELRSKN